MNKPFVIAQVSWLTLTSGNDGRRDSIIRHFYFVTKFLQDNALVHHKLIDRLDDIGDDFVIRSDDLTDDGVALMKAAYDKWLRKVDNGMEPSDVSALERALKEIRFNRT